DAARDQGVPFDVITLSDRRIRELYAAPLVIVRPDQHVAWRGERAHDPLGLIGTLRGAAVVGQPA
ncbi:MAG: monooxygenase, partial [Solirubrobacteraceae bacterium]